MKVVLDTNILIDAGSDDFSAQARIIDAIREGHINLMTTPAVEREYHKIINKLITDDEYREQLDDLLFAAHQVKGERIDVVIDDEEDRKFIEAAIGGHADHLVTNDRHLLDIGEVGDVKIVTPHEYWRIFAESKGKGEWSEWARGLGI